MGSVLKNMHPITKNFFIREMPIRDIKAEYNEEAITEYKRNRNGWLVLVTNDIRDKVHALEVYRNVLKCLVYY